MIYSIDKTVMRLCKEKVDTYLLQFIVYIVSRKKNKNKYKCAMGNVLAGLLLVNNTVT